MTEENRSDPGSTESWTERSRLAAAEKRRGEAWAHWAPPGTHCHGRGRHCHWRRHGCEHCSTRGVEDGPHPRGLSSRSCQSLRQAPSPSLCACIPLRWACGCPVGGGLWCWTRIDLIKVDDKKRGDWVGPCKTDRKGNHRHAPGCSCVVVKDYSKDFRPKMSLRSYFKCKKWKNKFGFCFLKNNLCLVGPISRLPQRQFLLIFSSWMSHTFKFLE